ncbi:RNA polymerase sigma factor [uncultured Cyclobacterium sp.]|uniref:RNA polymerase sigma factor n=1 Tax=uncultured Cyclobacterium sp. TaxID=453820 RepID=UPI0030ECA57F
MKTEEFKNRVISMSERLYPMVARMLGSHANAEDAIQEIMIKLWERRKQIKNHPNLPGFIFLTAKNYCLDKIKKKTPTEDIYEAKHYEFPADQEQNSLEWKELKQLIEEIINRLPAQQREIIMMRDLDGLTFDEMAVLTTLRIDHIRVLLSRARKQVTKELQKSYSYGKGEY